MTKIVGHRGATGIELENTIKGFKLAKSLGVDAIEFDVASTKDGKFVVCHDDNIKKLSRHSVSISKLFYSELAEIKLHNGESVPLLYDVLSLVRGIPIIIDIKTDDHLPSLFQIIDKFPDLDITLTTDSKFMHRIHEAKRISPHLPFLAPRHYFPGGLIRTARKYNAQGLNLNYLLMNPVTYWIAEKRGLKIQVYTVNKVWVARLFQKLYPNILICTNHPDKLLAAL